MGRKFMFILRSSAKRQNAVRVITRMPWHATRLSYTTALGAGGCPLQHITTWDQKGWHGLASLNDSGPLLLPKLMGYDSGLNL